MTDAEINAAAERDPDNPPMPPEELARLRPIPLSKRLRWALSLSREQFSAAYGIPVETLRAWDRHEAEPDPVALAYLHAIERAPEATRVPEPA